MAVDSRYVERLDGTGIDRDEAGGKAWALDRLVEHGFPVPEAVVIRASAYRRFARSGAIAELVDRIVAGPPPEPGEVAAAEAAIEAEFIRAAPPADVRDEVGACLGEMLARGPVAVRSSATAEDLTGMSFAGQYRTFLGVDALDDAITAVRRCWASLWFPSARAYRERVGFDDAGLAMAVIVQRLIPADWSGVVFTRDPQGDGSTLRIEAVTGMGEKLVSGRVTPGDFVLDRRTLEVVTAKRGRPPFLEDLGRLGLRIERRLGEPQDIEWSTDGDHLWVLQSRPITVHAPLAPDDDGFDTDAGPDDTFTPQGVAEMLPGVLPPLVWSINRPMLEQAFRSMFAGLGAETPEVGRSIVARFRARAAINLSALRDAARSLPAGSADEVDYAYLGERAPEPSQADSGSGRASLRVIYRNWKAQRRVEDEVRVLCTAVGCLTLVEPMLGRLPVVQLLAYRRELRDLAGRGTAAELAASAAAGSAYHTLEVLLARWLGEEEGLLQAQRVTSGTLGRSMVGPSRLSVLEELVREHATPGLRRTLAAGPVTETRRRLVGFGADGVALAAAVDQAGKEFGSIAVYAGPTFAEDDERLWQMVAAIDDTGPRTSEGSADEAIDAVLATLAKDRRWRLARVATGQFIDLRRRLLLRLTGDAVRFLTLREEAKRALLSLGGMERRVIIEGASRLARSGHLASVGDVDFLSDVEVEEMLLGGEPVTAVELERRKDALERGIGGGALPSSFIGSPDAPAGAPQGGDALRGWAASAGIARGRVRRIDHLADGDLLEPGEVIVATATDPSWTPLFLRATAIVLEQGGPLSHAAIVAREFGLPAVLNVSGAVAALHDGEIVEVDGTHGEVRIVTAEPSAAGVP